jgi:uncharacterized protein YndB with AHSA1/START domain
VTSANAVSVVRQYHDAWTTKNYGRAIELLAPTLTVEVPINDYPTAESFGQALRGFGELVLRVDVLSEMSSGDEVMQLYDMQVEGLGRLRVVEHFTVAGEQIVRLRQIHDTAAVSAAVTRRRNHEANIKSSVTGERDYAREIRFSAPTERVFDALTTLGGLGGWWTPIVSGNPNTAGEIRFGFAGLDEEIVMRVNEANCPSTVIWSCLTHTAHPEWEGTTIRFQLQPNSDGTGLLRFQHIGLTPRLGCDQTCETGWERFLTSLLDYAEHGTGEPF